MVTRGPGTPGSHSILRPFSHFGNAPPGRAGLHDIPPEPGLLEAAINRTPQLPLRAGKAGKAGEAYVLVIPNRSTALSPGGGKFPSPTHLGSEDGIRYSER